MKVSKFNFKFHFVLNSIFYVIYSVCQTFIIMLLTYFFPIFPENMPSIFKYVGHSLCIRNQCAFNFFHMRLGSKQGLLSCPSLQPFSSFANDSSSSIISEFEPKQFFLSPKKSSVLQNDLVFQDFVSSFDKRREMLKRKLLVKTMSEFASKFSSLKMRGLMACF